jgi:integrase
MRKTLTDITVSRLKAPASARLEVFDVLTPGFGLRITARDVRTYFVVYRLKGERRKHRLTLGDARKLTLAEARDQAKDALALAQTGQSPKVQRAVAVATAKSDDALTVEQLEADAKTREENLFKTVAELYITRHAKPNLRHWRTVERTLDRELVDRWGTWQIQDVTRRHIIAMVDEVATRAPIMANRVHALASKLFGWAIERGILDVNPMVGVKKPSKERSRDRVLTDDELRAVWLAADTVGYPGGPLVRLLILSAARLNEIAQLTHAQIDGDVIALPETKNGRPHRIPITAPMREALDALPEFEGEYLLTGTAGRRPMQNFSDIKTRIDDVCMVGGWTYHDLRRTAASGMASLGIAPHIIEAALNHQSGAVSGIARVYNRFSYDVEKRAALEQWATEVMRIVEGRPREVAEGPKA